MRKAMIGLIMAATVMTPIAAEAQNRDRDGRRDRAERTQRLEQRGEQRIERRQQRQEQRQEQRSERREQRREARQEVRQQPPARVVQRERRGDRGDRRADGNRPGSVYPQAWQGNPNDPMRRHYEELERRNQYRYGTREQRREVRQERRGDRQDWRRDRRDDRRDWRRDRRDDRRDWRDRGDDRRDWRDRRDWDRRWRSDRRYDWNGWRYRNRSLFRLPRYYSPYRNWSYRRFDIGFFLQPLFYNQRYWIGDPWQYRLPPAYPGTQWVRYYNDVLLVDIYTGEVIDVIYDFFW